MSGSRPISFVSVRGLADQIFVFIGLWSNQVLRYSVVARHIFLWLAYHLVRFFSARHRAYQSFLLSDCRPFKLLVLGAQSMMFSLFSSWPIRCFHVGTGGNQTFLRCKFCPFHWGFFEAELELIQEFLPVPWPIRMVVAAGGRRENRQMFGSQKKLFSSIDMLVIIHGTWYKSHTLIKRAIGSGGP